jgi:hypothetical protein
MDFFDFFETFSNVFHDLKNVKIAEKHLKIGQFLPILATFYDITFLKKLVEVGAITYFQFDVF